MGCLSSVWPGFGKEWSGCPLKSRLGIGCTVGRGNKPGWRTPKSEDLGHNHTSKATTGT